MNVLINAHGHALRKRMGSLGSDVLHWYTELGNCEISDPQVLNIDLDSYIYTEIAGSKPSEFPYDHYLGFSSAGNHASLLDKTSAFGAYYMDKDNNYIRIEHLPEEGKLSEIIKIIKQYVFKKTNYSEPIHFYISACRQIPDGNGMKWNKTKRRKNIKRRRRNSLKRRKTK